jgi:hypothetical protein
LSGDATHPTVTLEDRTRIVFDLERLSVSVESGKE